jgi:hypothetical protein
MKIVKLSGSQTRTLANLGVDTTADVFIPANKGAGSYTFCTHCFHQGFEQIGDEAIKICKNPAVDTGIATAQCYWKNRPIEVGSALECVGCGYDLDPEGACRRCDTPREVQSEGKPQDDLDRSFLVTTDGANPTASREVEGQIEKSTFHTRDSEDK